MMHFFGCAIAYFFIYNISFVGDGLCGQEREKKRTEASCEEVCQLGSVDREKTYSPTKSQTHWSVAFA